MSDTTCPKCGADLTKENAIGYLSGDTNDCHYELREDGKIYLVMDEEGECDSRLWCTKCGCEEIPDYDENEVWD